MAKGLRSSVKKANKTKLRARVFGPIEDARTQRLSAKLLELASQPKPSKPLDIQMDVEEQGQYSDSMSRWRTQLRFETEDGAGKEAMNKNQPAQGEGQCPD
jgi:hypothetical protein